MVAHSTGQRRSADMKTGNHRVLIIDDERPVLMTLEALLKRHGYHVDTAPTASQGLKLIRSKSPTLILLDLQLPDADGLETLDRIKTEVPQIQVIILTAHDSLHNAIESIKRGAYHFISKPYAAEELLSLVEKALEKQFLLREAEELREKTEQLERRLEVAEARPALIFKSKPMQEIDELINAMAPSDANALIVGDSGTLFLDEISDMPAELQTRFLRVLQEREYRPLGSTQTMKADFRAIASTNRPVAQALSENRLRSDLYYRLNTFQIEVPPLRKRKQDIPLLIAAFVKQFAQQLGKPEPDISPEAFQKLLDYSWPGNVRELQNAIEYAVVLARQGVVGVKELPTEIQLPPALQQAEIAGLPRAGVQTLDDVERTAIIQALAECHGNKKKAAELLGIQRPTLYNKMKRYAIEL